MKKSSLMVLIALGVILFFFMSFQFSIHRYVKKGAIPEDHVFVTKSIQVEGYTKINIDHHIKAFFKQDSAKHVQIEAPKNLMSYIEARVHNDELTIKKTKRTSSEDSILVFITNPRLDQLIINNGASFETKSRVSGEKLLLKFGNRCHGKLELSYALVKCNVSDNAKIKITGSSKEIDFSN